MAGLKKRKISDYVHFVLEYLTKMGGHDNPVPHAKSITFQFKILSGWNRILFYVLNNMLFQLLRKPVAKSKFTMMHSQEIDYHVSLWGIITKCYLHLNFL